LLGFIGFVMLLGPVKSAPLLPTVNFTGLRLFELGV